ncbi:winged helix-turn-helix transcriptional regulator [Streptomyces sp. 4N509B]|uniref:winged helix-turn-helix transcriptional regulator n=1 Tax=Streptomyces sp. 4N509B TaxID=3457413 RepID=UPI003FD37998
MSAGHTAVTTPARGTPVVDCSTPREECAVRDVLDRLGDRWSVYVIVELSAGLRRFKELQRAIPGDISQRMLTLTVRRLERDGLVRRTVYPTVPPRVEYELTETGHSFTHLVRALADWSTAHRPAIAAAREAWDAAADDARRHPDPPGRGARTS